MPRIKNFYLQTSILSFLLISIIVGVGQVQKIQNLRSKAQVTTPLSSCSSISVSPPVGTNYRPGENVTITIQAQGQISGVEVRRVLASRNLIQQPPYAPAFVPESITTGSYNPQTKTWTGIWVVPENGEYLIWPNIYQPNGQLCSGNPGYLCSGCEKGTLAGAGLEGGRVACNSCQKTIVVDDTVRNSQSFDMKEYFNLNPGSYWIYNGVDYRPKKADPNNNVINYKTRAAAEEKVKVCGSDLIPLRFTKTRREGYIYIDHDVNYRIFISYFQPGERWSADTVGKLISKFYGMDSRNYEGRLGPLGLESDSGFSGTDRHAAIDAVRLFENTFYAPHLYFNRYANTGWYIKKYDKLYHTARDYLQQCNWRYGSSPDDLGDGNISDDGSTFAERYSENGVFIDDVQTPVYSGPAVRVRFFETGVPIGQRWMIREDWYFARGLGRVQLNGRLLTGKCHDSNGNRLPNPDPDCFGTAKIVNPDWELKLSGYYLGGALTTNIEPKTIVGLGKWTLTASSPTGPYTGYLEAKTCISETTCTPGVPFKWWAGGDDHVWVENGRVEIDLNILPERYRQSGLRHVYFRPWVERSPSDAVAETRVTTTELPWSNENVFRITF